MSRERSKGIVGIFILVSVLFFVFIVFAFFTVSKLKDSNTLGTDVLSKGEKSPIAVITIENEIMDSKKTVELLQRAEDDKTIKAIILRINSPGGAVAPTQEIYQEVRRIDADKPIYASFGSIAASGGYYIGAATREIWANAGTLTGSIGVIMQMADLSELYQFLKYKPETIKAGRFKDTGNPARALTAEEKQYLESLLAGTHKQFLDDILEVRKDRLKKDINELGQGQIFHGKEAAEYGLVDKVGGLWEAGRSIHKELGLEEKFGLRFMKGPRKKFSVSDFLHDAEEAMSDLRQKMSSQTAPAFLYQPGM